MSRNSKAKAEAHAREVLRSALADFKGPPDVDTARVLIALTKADYSTTRAFGAIHAEFKPGVDPWFDDNPGYAGGVSPFERLQITLIDVLVRAAKFSV